jgi:predicted phosphodiesterase
MANIRKRGIDTVVNLGDHISSPLWPRETIDVLIRTDWIHIAGNNDRTLLSGDLTSLGQSDAYAWKHLDAHHLEWLKGLRSTTTWYETICLCHGIPSDDTTYLADSIENGRLRLATPTEITGRLQGTPSKVVLCGHSHMPRVVRSADATTIINPGSVGLQAYVDDGPYPHVVECGSPHARYAVITIDGDACSVDLIAVPYDHHLAAEQARKNGRLEWAEALESGYVSK